MRHSTRTSVVKSSHCSYSYTDGKLGSALISYKTNLQAYPSRTGIEILCSVFESNWTICGGITAKTFSPFCVPVFDLSTLKVQGR